MWICWHDTVIYNNVFGLPLVSSMELLQPWDFLSDKSHESDFFTLNKPLSSTRGYVN